MLTRIYNLTLGGRRCGTCGGSGQATCSGMNGQIETYRWPHRAGARSQVQHGSVIISSSSRINVSRPTVTYVRMFTRHSMAPSNAPLSPGSPLTHPYWRLFVVSAERLTSGRLVVPVTQTRWPFPYTQCSNWISTLCSKKVTPKFKSL